MIVRIVNVWSHRNRGDLAIALGTMELWGSHPAIGSIEVVGMDGRPLDPAALGSLAQAWSEDGSALLRADHGRPSTMPTVTVALGGHYLKAVSGWPRSSVRVRRLVRRIGEHGDAERLVFWGHSLGPFRPPASANPLVRLVNSSLGIGCREERSKRIASELGVAPDKLFVMGDPALHLAPPSAASVETTIADLGLTEPYLVVSVRQPEHRSTPSGSFARYVDEVARFLERARDLRAVVVAQCTGPTPTEDDRIAARAVSERLGGAHHVTVLDRPLGLSQLQALYAGARLTVATRLHAAILGFTSGTPAVGIDYAGPKASGVFEMIGLAGMTLRYEELTARALTSLVERVLADREGLSDVIDRNVRSLRDRNTRLRDAIIDAVRDRGSADLLRGGRIE